MEKRKFKKCRTCGDPFIPRFRTTEAFCSYRCAKEHSTHQKTSRKPMRKISRKNGARMREYANQRRSFLSEPKNEKCLIKRNGIPCGKKATTIEHSKGRQGYADDFARENDIWLLNDERFWIPACLKCNLELENNPDLSMENQISRLSDSPRGLK